jgi:RHS repeat-associated protein
MAWLLLLLLPCWSATVAWAQGTSPQRGFNPAGSYALTDLETVNTVNGNTMFRIPLASLPAGRGGLSANLSLMYSSKLWDTPLVQVPDPNNYQQRVTRYYLKNSPQSGWRYGFEYKLQLVNKLDGYMYSDYAPNCETEAPAGTDYASRIWKLQMIFPDGSVHEFVPQGYQSAYYTYGDGYYKIRPDGLLTHCVCHRYLDEWTCSQPNDLVTSNTMSYYSTDGTYLRLDIPHDETTGMTNKAWTLYLPDGGRVTSYGMTDTSGTSNVEGPERIYDRNNNYIEIQKTTSNNHPATRIVDQMNRSIMIEYGAAPNQDNIYAKGFNGDLQWTVKWKTIYVNKTYYTDENNSLYPQNLNQSLTVVDQVILPIQSGNLAYTFDYNGAAASDYPNGGTVNPSVGWGELNAITLPSGARANYVYRQDNINTARWYEVLQNYPTQKEMVYRSEYDLSSQVSNSPCNLQTESCITERWLYSFNFLHRDSTSTLSTVTAPDGGVTTDYIKYSQLSPPEFDHAMSYRTDKPDGTIIERRWQANVPNNYFNGSGGGCYGSSCNAYVKTEYVTIKNAAGVPVKTAIKDYQYDKNGNVTRVAEYDWVDYSSLHDANGNPNWTLPTVFPKKVTVNTYDSPTPDASDSSTPSGNAYHVAGLPRLHNAIKSSEVSDGSQVLARTEFSYDDATTTGNLIEQRSWDSTRGSYNSTLSATNSISVSYQYDNNTADPALRYGNRTLVTDALGHQTKYVYGSVGGATDLYPTQVIAAYGAPVKRTTNQAYDFNTGLMTSVTDVENDVTATTDYDVFGRPTTVKRAINTGAETHTNTSYDDVARRVIVRTDLDNLEDRKLVHIQHYDQLERVRLTRQLEDASSQSETSETTGIKVQTRYLIDNQNHLSYQLVSNPYRTAKSSDASGETTMGWTSIKSDNGGRVIEAESFAGAARPLPFDIPASANTSSTGKDTTLYDGIYTTVMDQAGKVRRSKVDGLGQMVRVDEPNSNTDPPDLGPPDAPLQQTNYSYDALGNLALVCQGGVILNNQCQSGQSRSFQYSSLSRLVSATNPESGTVEYRYDDGGNLILKIDPRDGGVALPNCLIPYGGNKVATCYGYDALNRVTTRTYNDGTAPGYSDRTPQVTYTYDTSPYGKGRLASVSSSVSTTSYQSYDALGRVTSSSQMTDGQTYTMPEYVYDRAGNLKSQKYPSGKVIANDYDVAGRLAGVKYQAGSSSYYYAGGSSLSSDTETYPNRIQYSAHGAVSALRLGNGLWEHTAFNSRLQPVQIGLGTSSTDSSKLQLDYGYGTINKNNGNVRSQTISFAGLTTSIVQNYDYDQLNRLSSFTETGTLSQTFAYDAYGNQAVTSGHVADPLLTPQSLSAYSMINNVTNNRLASSTYDAAGNQTQDAAGRSFTYDAENHQTSFNGSAAFYSYDGDGRRVRKTDMSGRSIFVYNALGQVVAEYSNASQMNPEADKTSYLTDDALGTPRVITGSNGQVKARHDYLPFGEELLTNVASGATVRTEGQGYVSGLGNGKDTLNQKFTGKERDGESGLDYFGARYYSSTQGRFTSVDPSRKSIVLTNPQSWNGYVYCLNDPLRYIDQNGKWPTRTHDKIIEKAFDGLSGKQIRQIQKGSESVDANLDKPIRLILENTLVESMAPRHAMTPGFMVRKLGSVSAAQEWSRQQATHYINEKMGEAKKIYSNSQNKDHVPNAALEVFGQGVHTIMDGASPAHREFQVYDLAPYKELFVINPVGAIVAYKDSMDVHGTIEARPPTEEEMNQMVDDMRMQYLNTFGREMYEQAVSPEERAATERRRNPQR